MKNEAVWKETKFVVGRNGTLQASRNSNHVGVGSRFVTDIMAKKLDDAIQRHASGDLVDIGCGSAPLYVSYRKKVDDITCIDYDGSLHEKIFIDHFQDLNEKLNLDDALYDTALMTSVLEHIYEPKQLLREIHRVLKPNGKLIMNVPFYYWLHEEPHDYHRYTRYCLDRYLKDTGFSVLELKETGGVPEIMMDIVCKLTGRVRVLGPAISATTRMVNGFGFTRALSRRTAPSFPLGYLAIAQKRPETS